MENIKSIFTFSAITLVCIASVFIITFNTPNIIPSDFHLINFEQIYQVTKLDNK